MTTATKQTVLCCSCGAGRDTKVTARGTARVPSGWKRQGDSVFCDKCWRNRYVLRAVTFAVSGPVDRSWEEFRAALRTAWSQTTAASNWMMSQLWARDTQRVPSQEKMPAMERVYLYPEARTRFPDLSSSTVASLEQQTQRKYRSDRYKVLWTCDRSIQNFKYPVPYPVPAATVKLSRGEGGEAIVSLPFGTERWSLRLRGGHRYRRQIAAFDKLVKGEAELGEVSIYRVSSGTNTHRAGDSGRDSGGQKSSSEVMLKIACWLPRVERAAASDVLRVSTGPESLWRALNEKDEQIWVLNADHIRRAQAEHGQRLHRLSEDATAEQRPVASFQSRRAAMVTKHHRRINSWFQQCAMQLAKYAQRRRMAAIRYDDSNKLYCVLDWTRLRLALAKACEDCGIELIVASGEVASESPEPLAQDVKE